MNQETRQVIRFILKIIHHRKPLFFWLFVRFISAFFPLISIYLFSHIIKLLELHESLNTLIFWVFIIFVILLVDNFTRLLSIFKLDYLIANIQFDIHNFLIPGVEIKVKSVRHETVQAVRNFSDAVRVTLELLRQPGIDSFVSLIITPTILFFLDFRVFILQITYILIYLFVDFYTTQRYITLKNILNSKVEAYYAQLQDSNDIELEEKQFNRVIKKITNWGFIEWFSLQNIAVTFYSILLLYLIYSVNQGTKNISDLVLIMGYVVSTQVFLNSFSSIKDRLADTQVALLRLAKNESISTIDFGDLVK